MYNLPSTKQIVRYLHACAGFPTKTTWLKAIRARSYNTWPHLSAKNVQKHFPESDETQQGHMRSIKQGIRSTKAKLPAREVEQKDGTTLTLPLKKHNDVYFRVEEMKETMYTDQTDVFPVRSRRGNRYIMICCELDSNAILSEPMQNRTAGEMIKAYLCIMDRLLILGRGKTQKAHTRQRDLPGVQKGNY